ncbi:tripartite tricarboxylate transporter TctB family protein [Methylobacterium gregans]|uniref:DUF1468 domain-containing protein n=1 Tax=Methylobacterium gregans TaxID=374424 RepID=A0AA37HP77_9HYPH|nr:tripartite tricarboxylate transporter TctB family protein [Methylobacterium gregans]MDQ0523477.1 hypothetical protein [Methylobacterium gregans]GJD78598.1 hypothetical protein NBEOAGPD_1815 [Methylobacterium gregans]GLS55828.1 hypothetical protein GCM10007886_40130 [Methylobacterium gregans]
MEISRRTSEIATSAATALIGLIVCYGALENGIAWEEAGPSSGFFPFCVGCLILLGSAATGAQATLRPTEGQPPFLDGERARAAILFFLPIVAFAALAVFLGLYIAMAIYIVYAMYGPGKLKLATSIAAGLGVAVVNFVIFEKLFMVPLLKGPVLNAVGIY